MTPTIDRSAFESYLNDHLAGSVAALELMGRLAESLGPSPLGELMRRFKVELEEEQALVRRLVEQSGGAESPVRKAVAWFGEKVARLKVGPGTSDASGLMLFEALELLGVGFWGRRSLWRALAHLEREAPLHAGIPFTLLAEGAERQLSELEPFRLEAAIGALTVLPSTPRQAVG